MALLSGDEWSGWEAGSGFEREKNMSVVDVSFMDGAEGTRCVRVSRKPSMMYFIVLITSSKAPMQLKLRARCPQPFYYHCYRYLGKKNHPAEYPITSQAQQM